ncbi:hypothetical protein ACF064_08955 [Streptomyces sp. NPDC015492]|uniref:hypothetical protein n=1 Tax=Streptomyces sp. NPDC015492 TaxID=3364958 RepID=UPI0036FD3F0D
MLRQLRQDIGAVSPAYGLMDGFDAFMNVIEPAPTLKARLFHVQQQVHEAVVATLREETGAPADPLPLLVGGQLAWIESTVVGYITRAMTAGGRATTVSREALVLLDEIEELLGDKVLTYAVRED